MRVILDPNILISHLLPSRHESLADRLVDAAVTGAFTLLICDELVHELITRVQRKPYLANRISSAELTTLVDSLSYSAEYVDLSDVPFTRVVRDPNDDYLIALAVRGDADILVSGDHDVLAVANLTGFRIMSMRDFSDMLDVSETSETASNQR